MATAYHRDQAGAPGLTYSTATSGIQQFSALKVILKSCLITGYGAVPAAGWELINEGAAFLVLRNGSRSGYVCLTWVSGGVIRIYLSSTYTGMTGDVMTGDGLKTGLVANNTTPQSVSLYTVAYSSAYSSWAVVADSKTFVVSIISDTSNREIRDGVNYALCLYVGEDTNGNFISVGGDNTAGAYSSQNNCFSADSGFTSLSNPATGFLVGTSGLSAATTWTAKSTGGVSNIRTTIYTIPSVELARACWMGGGVYAGRLRGIAVCAEVLYHTYASYAAQCLGYSGPLYTRNASTPLDMSDGWAYFARMGHSQSPFFLITDNPEFW